jgi:hypothetical protein
MVPGRWLIVAAAVLLVLGLVFAGGAAAQRDAWMQGYMMGRLATGNDGGANAALLPYMYPGYGGPHFGGFGIFLLLGLLFLGFAAMRFFRFSAWREGGGPWGHGGGPGHWHGRRSPWWDEESAPNRQPQGEGTEGEPGSGHV